MIIELPLQLAIRHDDVVMNAGFINIPGSGSKALNYTFSMDSDDGSQLYMDGVLVINDARTAVTAAMRGLAGIRHECTCLPLSRLSSRVNVAKIRSVLVCLPIRPRAVSVACCKC